MFRNPKLRKALLAVLGLVVVLLLLAVAFPQAVLCVDHGDVKGDALVVLGGGYDERVEQALELYRAGAAPKIIISGKGDAGSHKRFLTENGVPPGAIQTESDSTSTRENAQFTIPLLRAGGAKRVIIVTSWYHSRRSLKCFRHYASDIDFFSRPSLWGMERSQWSSKRLTNFVRMEYIKIPGYWLRYGICPL